MTITMVVSVISIMTIVVLVHMLVAMATLMTIDIPMLLRQIPTRHRGRRGGEEEACNKLCFAISLLRFAMFLLCSAMFCYALLYIYIYIYIYYFFLFRFQTFPAGSREDFSRRI